MQKIAQLLLKENLTNLPSCFQHLLLFSAVMLTFSMSFWILRLMIDSVFLKQKGVGGG